MVADMRLEVVVLPVADVDRVVRFTPHGSGGSIQFGTSMTSPAEQARTTLPI